MKENSTVKTDVASSILPDILMTLPDTGFARLAVHGFGDPEGIQAQVLQQILKASAKTEYGQKHHFDRIRTMADYQAQVPVTQWCDVEPYADRMADGETDVLFPGLPREFVLTTGTSGNAMKRVPESQAGALAKQVVSRFRRMQLFRNFPQFDRTGYVLPLSNISLRPPTKAGIPVGFASGIALNNSMGEKQMLRIAYPLEVLLNRDPVSRDYLLLRFALQKRNVIMVVGNNAGRFSQLALQASRSAQAIIADIAGGTVRGAAGIDPAVLEKLSAHLSPDPARAEELQQILERTGDLLPKSYWPSLQLMTFWISGTVADYIKDVRPMVPETAVFFDAGYGASEVRINIPFLPGRAAGVLSIYTAFYEFLPEDGSAPLLAHQLEDGKTYELVVTTWSGLYRYNMRDTVKVEGFTGKTPNLVFVYKSGEILNIAEEKVPASTVAESIRQAAGAMGIEALQLQIHPWQEGRQYLCYIEAGCRLESSAVEALATAAHRFLSDACVPYDMMCNQQKLLVPLAVVAMKAGWGKSLYDARVATIGSGAQVKIPVMIRTGADAQWIQK